MLVVSIFGEYEHRGMPPQSVGGENCHDVRPRMQQKKVDINMQGEGVYRRDIDNIHPISQNLDYVPSNSRKKCIIHHQ